MKYIHECHFRCEFCMGYKTRFSFRIIAIHPQWSWIVVIGDLKHCQRLAKSSTMKLNRRDQWAEASPLSLIGDASAPLEWVFATASWSIAIELNRRQLALNEASSTTTELNNDGGLGFFGWLFVFFFLTEMAQREFVKWYWNVCGSWFFFFGCAGYWN